MSRTPRLEIYRPLQFPEGELAPILETQLNALDEFDAEVVHEVLTPAFIPRIKLLSFAETERIHNRADMPILRTGLEELASHVEYHLSEVGADETVPGVQMYPHAVHSPKNSPWKQTITIAGTGKVARERRGVRKYTQEFIKDASGIAVNPAKVWISDKEATRAPIARSLNTKEAQVVERLSGLLAVAALSHNVTVTLLPVVYDVSV